MLANTGLGTVYRSIAPKYSLLSKIPLKIQMRAFALATVVQGIFMYRYPPQEREGFSKRKAFEVLAPYLLISTSIAICHRQAFKANIMSTAVLGTIQLAVSQLISTSIAICHRQAFKANIMSTAVLGTIQLAVSQLSPKIVTALPLMVLRDFDPEELAFGKADWERFFGEVGDVPSIPAGMAETLKAPCKPIPIINLLG